MARTLPLVVAVLLLLVGGWFAWDSIRGAGLEQRATEGTDRSAAPTGEAAEANARAGELTAAAQEVSRKEIETAVPQRTEEIPDDQAIRVRVVQGPKKQPAPGATVQYLPMDWADKLSDKERAEAREQLVSTTAWMSRFGYLARVDGQGMATVRRAVKGTLVHGRLGDLAGLLSIEPGALEPVDGWCLELTKEWSLRVQVIDRDDKPVSGIPIVLVGTYESYYIPGLQQLGLKLGKTREPDGIFEQEEIGQFINRWTYQGALADTACALGLPGLMGIKAPFDAARPPAEPLRLVLPDTGSLHVEVVDAAGKAITGESAIEVSVPGDENKHRETARTGGMFRFPRVAPGKSYQLTAYVLPLIQEKTVAGPTAAGEEVSVKITLPATGKVVVRLLGPKGRPIKSPDVGFELTKQGSEYTYHRPRFEEDGTATFEQVPLGETWDVSAHILGRRLAKQILGPTHPGETVPVEFALSDSVAFLAGRALDVDRSPLANRGIWIRYRLEDGGGGGGGTDTDGKGRFLCIMSNRLIGRPLARLQLRLQDPRGGDTGESAEPPHPAALPKGITDLGDVILRRQPIVVSGTLTGYQPDRHGQRPSFRVERLRVYKRRGVEEEHWPTDQSVALVWGEGSDFEFRGTPEPGRLRLEVSARGYLPVPPIEFILGTTGLEVPVVQGGSVIALVKVDRGTQPTTLHARLVPTSGQPDTKDWDNPLVGEIDFDRPRAPDELAYRWIGLHAGVYRLEIGPKGAKPLPVMVANIEVFAGRETRDVRLQELDLRGKLRQVTLTIQTPDGKPLGMTSFASVVLVRPPGKLTDLEGQSIDSHGQAKLSFEGGPLRVMVMVQGYPVKDVDGVLEDTTIRLDPPLRVVVRLRGGGPTLPEGGKLHLTLSSTRKRDPATAGLRYRTPSSGGGLDYMLNPPVPRVTVKDGVAVFQVCQPGEYQVYGTIAGISSAEHRVLHATPKTLQVRDTTAQQSFEVEIPQDAVRKQQ